MSTDTGEVDVRGPRFAAWISTAVLVLTLAVSAASATAAAIILSAQAVVFAISAWRGPRTSPYGLLFRTFIAPRLGPVPDREPVVGFAAAIPLLGVVATAFALFAAFLNAAFGICLGCQLYPLVARLRRVPAA
jgi:hypothetical protein